MPNFQFDFTDDQKELLIWVKVPKFDAASIAEFKNDLDKIWNKKISTVVIDFSKVRFIDSSGIGALLSIQKRLKPESEPVKILNAKPAVIKVIELLRLHRVFNLQND